MVTATPWEELQAAVKELTPKDQQEFVLDYLTFCQQYGILDLEKPIVRVYRADGTQAAFMDLPTGEAVIYGVSQP